MRNPDNKQRIEGRFLLDLRARINKLEHQVQELRMELETLKK